MPDYDSAKNTVQIEPETVIVLAAVLLAIALSCASIPPKDPAWNVIHTGVLKQATKEYIEFDDGFVLSKKAVLENDYWEIGKTYNLLRSRDETYKLEEPSGAKAQDHLR